MTPVSLRHLTHQLQQRGGNLRSILGQGNTVKILGENWKPIDQDYSNDTVSTFSTICIPWYSYY
jgi:hypothetical protein